MTDVVLKVAGKEFKGWETIEIVKSITDMAGSFTLEVSNRNPGKTAYKLPIYNGDSCTVALGNNVLVTGYIEVINTQYSANSHTISFSGRDKTGDLIDCSYPVSTDASNLWKQLTIKQVIQRLCDPFGITVYTEGAAAAQLAFTKANAGTKNEFTVNPGTPVFDQISQLCIRHGLLPLSLGDGYLTLTTAGEFSTSTIISSAGAKRNVLSGKLVEDNSIRYSDYFVRGGGVTSALGLGSVLNVSGSAHDDLVDRTRVKVILETNLTIGEAIKRAEWESRVRAGKSRTATYTIQGWEQDNGELWFINTLVQVEDPILGIDKEERLITDVLYSLTPDEGSTVQLTVMHKDAFDLDGAPVDKITGTHDSFLGF